MLEFYDILFTVLHLLITGFNLVGWIWKKTRKIHLYTVLLTIGSWLILGIWHGLGYCVLTDWHWDVKRKLGEKNLPGSFIKYFADRFTGNDFNAEMVNNVTAIVFACIVVVTILVNFRDYRK